MVHDLPIPTCGTRGGNCNRHHRGRGCLLPIPDPNLLCEALGKSNRTTTAYIHALFSDLSFLPQINIIKDISLGAAVISILMFVKNLKPQLEEHKPMIKLIAFKLVVALGFVQNVSTSLLFLYLLDFPPIYAQDDTCTRTSEANSRRFSRSYG